MNDKIYCINCFHYLGTPNNVRFNDYKDDSANDGDFQMLIQCPVCGVETHVTVHRIYITCKPWAGEFD